MALTRSRLKAAAAIAAGYALESVFIDHGSPVFRFPPAAAEYFDRVHRFLRDIDDQANLARSQRAQQQ